MKKSKRIREGFENNPERITRVRRNVENNFEMRSKRIRLEFGKNSKRMVKRFHKASK